MIANNRQIAGMVKANVKNKKDFNGIEGFGEAKITRYAEDIIKTLISHQNPGTDDKRETEEGESQ